MDCGVDHTKQSIRKEACWVISNIAAGSVEQIQAVIDSGVFPKLIEFLKRDDQNDVRKEAVWIVCNALDGGNEDQHIFLLRSGVIVPLVKLLENADTRVVTVALGGLKRIFERAIENGEMRATEVFELILACDGVETVEKLQNHENTTIHEQSTKLLELIEKVKENYVDTNYILK